MLERCEGILAHQGHITDVLSSSNSLWQTPEPISVDLQVVAVHSSEPSEQTKYTTWCKNPKDEYRLGFCVFEGKVRR